MFSHTAFLCGHFSMSCPRPAEVLSPHWIHVLHNPEDEKEDRRYFYPEFVEFCYGSGRNAGMDIWRMPVGREVPALSWGGNCPVLLKELTLYLLPYDIVVYSLETYIESSDMNDFTSAMSRLRTLSFYDRERCPELYESAAVPLTEAFRKLSPGSGRTGTVSFGSLLENGNKLKIFQITNASGLSALDSRRKDFLLFELGTVSRIGSCENKGSDGIAEEYIDGLLAGGKLCFYNNWTALSLFDTFTILADNAPDWLVMNWRSSYFRMIYLHSLFLKFYLFRLNMRFRKGCFKASALDDELLAFENKYCFHKISYNFLPLQIYKAIDRSFEISEEREQLYHLIDMESRQAEEKNDRKVNSLLLFLTLLTMFSTIWDTTSLLNELYPYSDYVGSSVIGFRAATSLISLLILAVISGIFLRRRKI